MKFKIVCDSSSNVFHRDDVDYMTVPLRIRTENKEYVDDENLDMQELVTDLKSITTQSKTSCPNAGEWMDAFEDADCVFAITISSNLSGSYNAACLAKQEYPDKKIEVIDSLSTGAGMQFITDRIVLDINKGMEFEEICEDVKEYYKHCHLFFALESLTNLANNGRVSPIIAKGAGLLGIRLLGKASDVGTIEEVRKFRGSKKTVKGTFEEMKKLGYKGGRIKIDHVFNEQVCLQLKDLVLAEFPNAQFEIGTCKGLCGFYAEQGGFILGFEDL